MSAILGFGFRRDAPLAALLAAVAATGGQARARALATAADKARAPQARALAQELNLPLIAIPNAVLAAQSTVTASPRVAALYGAGSLAEAAALAAAGPGATLTAARVLSPDRTASAALAEGPET